MIAYSWQNPATTLSHIHTKAFVSPAAATQADAEAKADTASTTLATITSGAKVIFIPGAIATIGTDMIQYADSTETASTITTGPFTTDATDWLGFFCARILANGSDFDVIAFDVEDVFQWDVTFNPLAGAAREAYAQAIYDADDITPSLPTERIRNRLIPSDYQATGTSTDPAAPRNIWNNYAFYFQSMAMMRLGNAVTTAMGHPVLMTNYGDAHQSFRTYRNKGYERGVQFMGPYSSPKLYLHLTGARYSALSKNQSWAHFLDLLNMARSALGTSKEVIPWISGPTFEDLGDTWTTSPVLWRELVFHLTAMGIRRCFMFQPTTDTSYEAHLAYANGVLKEAQDSMGLPPPQSDLSELTDLEADSVTSGEGSSWEYTTNYADVVDYLP